MPDVATTRDFFVTHLGFTHVATRGQDGLAILADGHGTTLVLSKQRATGPKGLPDGMHVGFYLASPAEVDALHARLAEAGVALAMAPRQLRGGWGFYFNAPGPLMVEVSHVP